MSQTIQIKRSTGTVIPSSLAAGELAYSFKSDTKKLYIGDGSNVITIGGQAFTDKLDGIEANADVTDATNVTAAGALMDSECASVADVKTINQALTTTSSPSFSAVTVNGNIEFDGLSGTGTVNVTDIKDEDDMSSDSATALATQQSIKAFVTGQGYVTSSGVTSISTGTANQVTITDGSTATPEIDILTSAVSNGGTALATGDQIHDFVTGLLGDFTFSGGEISSTQSTITIDPSVNGPSGVVVIDGSLEVKGTTTTVDSTTVTLADNIIRLNKDYSSAPSGTATYGIELNRGTPTDGTQTLVSFLYNETGDKWTVETKNGTHNEIIHTGNSASATYTLDGGTF